MPKKGRRQQKKSSLMGVPFSRSTKLDMSKVINTHDLDGVAEYIKTHNPKNIVLCVGAGISTNSGIPDFRTPGTGVYDNLAALKLPYPEAVFSLQYFRQDPDPFYTLAQSLYPGAFKPTLTHTFIRLLQDKSILLRCFTQNIDTLERIAGVVQDNIVEAHGSFAESRCIDCKLQYPKDKMKEMVDDKKIPRCPECDGLVKPDIVFFGEALPERFFTRRVDMHHTDLVFVIGTSLVVYPFAALPDYTRPSVPRVVLNIDAVENFERPNDVYVAGDCDESIWSLCQKLGWEKDLWKLHNEIGGVDGDWELRSGGKKSPAESEDTTVGEPGVEDAVAQLTRELEQELRLDKDEDVEGKKIEGKVDKPDESLLRTETRDDDAAVVSKKDGQSSETTKENSLSKDSKETTTGDPKEKL